MSRPNTSAQFVLDLLDRGTYTTDTGRRVDIRAAHAASVASTVVYTPSDVAALIDEPAPGAPALEVTAGTSGDALFDDPGDGLLNFASARNPGGGFLGGARAQEEELCRCSGLYATLLTQPAYYRANRAHKSLLYTDHGIVSPRVVFFRRAARSPLVDPVTTTVITAPAPNAGPFLARNPGGEAEVRTTFLRRWQMVFAIAREQGLSDLILGAWGCGAFRNDPQVAAETAMQALASHGGGIGRVRFAIPDKGRRSRANLAAFQRVLLG